MFPSKRGRFPAIDQSAENIESIRFRDDRAQDKSIVISQDTEVKEFMTLLQQEIYEMTFAELVTNRRNYISATVNNADGSTVQYAIRESFGSLFQWLEEKHYYDMIMLLPEEIDYIVIENQQKDRVEIRERQLIEELLSLKSYQDSGRNNDFYWIGYYYKGQVNRPYFQERMFLGENLSGELMSYLDQLK